MTPLQRETTKFLIPTVSEQKNRPPCICINNILRQINNKNQLFQVISTINGTRLTVTVRFEIKSF